MAQTKQHANKGGNAGVFKNLTRKGMPADKAKDVAKKFRKNANKKKGT